MKQINISDLINPDSKFDDELTAEQVSDAIKIGMKHLHRNTRHDAVEKMLEIRARWAKTHNFAMCDAMLDEITGAIMNIPIRY
jgi:hypothetical protein